MYEWILVIGFIGILIIGVWVITSALDHRDWTMDKEMEAIFNFYVQFAEYVKEMDLDMWRRAADYATEYHNTDGVKFTKIEDEQWVK